MWIGTRNGGLNKFDIDKGTFESYKNKKDDPRSLSNDRVRSIVVDSSGEIWVGTIGGGLNRFDPSTNKFDRFLHDPENDGSISSNDVQCLFLGSNQQLWIGTTDGLNKYNKSTGKFTRYNHDSTPGTLSNNNVLSIWEDANQKLWIGTKGGGLNVMRRSDEYFRSHVNSKNNNQSLSNNDVLTLLGAGNGKIWVGTDGGYLNLFDPSTSVFSLYKVSYPRVRTIYEDRVGDVWVGIRGGLNRIGKRNSMFTQYNTDSQGDLISPNGDIHAICEDKEGYIWTGSSVDGLKKINRKTLNVLTYTHTEKLNSLSNNNIRFLFIDSDETMWVATENGLNKYNKPTDDFTRYQPDKDDPYSLSSGRISQIYEDSKNNLLICTDQGLNILNKSSGRFRVIKKREGSNSLHLNNVESVIEDDQGIFWISYSSNGFDRYDPNSGEFKHYKHEEGNSNSLSNDRVFHIYDDKRGNLWLATYGGGLNKFDKSSEKFTHYNGKHGLANSSLYCVIEDESNNLWMSHNEGISKFDTSKETFKNYLEGIEFNSRAFYKGKSGEIFFASYNVVSFFAENANDNIIIPPVHINQFELFKEIITPMSDKDILQNVVEETDTLILQHDQNFFSFGFVSLNFTYAKNNKFKYKLENFDEDWNEAWEYPHANYTNVPPGEYTFRVVGSNNDQVWNEEGDSIYIEILSPWWETLLFKIVATLSIFGIL